MKYLALAALALASISTPAAASSNPYGLYVRVDTGASFSTSGGQDLSNTDFGTSAIVGAGVGMRINDHFRVDGTLGYRGWYHPSYSGVVLGQNASAKADVKSLDALMNIYFDIIKLDRFTPYVGAGAGASYNSVSNFDVSVNGQQIGSITNNDQTSFAWQVMAGTNVTITPNLALDLSYHYFDAGHLSSGNTVAGTSVSVPRLSADLKANEIQIGLRYKF
jgi:opacity protein-like surface antigen